MRLAFKSSPAPMVGSAVLICAALALTGCKSSDQAGADPTSGQSQPPVSTAPSPSGSHEGVTGGTDSGSSTSSSSHNAPFYPNAPLSPAGLRLTSLEEQDGEGLAMGFDTGGAGSRALANYRAQLSRSGWDNDEHGAVKGDVNLHYDVEGDGELALFVSQVRVPDLAFQRGTVEGGRTHWYFNMSGHPDASAEYQSKLTKLGYKVRDLGGAEEAVKGDTTLHFGPDSQSVMWVSVEKLG